MFILPLVPAKAETQGHEYENVALDSRLRNERRMDR
jgi:hypothetical protein